jgi:plastocyanin
MQFSPVRLSVHRGDRIVWANKDLFPHTVTAGNKAFDSGAIEAGGSWSYVAGKAAVYAYSCTFHPTMKGAITVQ